jgi:hypothetical protein
MCKRNAGESFSNYRARRSSERAALDVYLQGRPIVIGNGTNRADIRSRLFRSKHHGSQTNRRKRGSGSAGLLRTTAPSRSLSSMAEAATAA